MTAYLMPANWRKNANILSYLRKQVSITKKTKYKIDSSFRWNDDLFNAGQLAEECKHIVIPAKAGIHFLV